MPRLKNPKAKGSRAERKSKALLEAKGYYCVKAGGSFGAADILAVRKGEIILCQVKCGQARLKPAEREELIKLAVKLGAIAQLHQWPDRAKEPTIECLASKSSVKRLEKIEEVEARYKAGAYISAADGIEYLDAVTREQHIRGCSCGGNDALKIAHGDNCKASSRGALYENCFDMKCQSPHVRVGQHSCHELEKPRIL
jgi:Holliday junction resolvase